MPKPKDAPTIEPTLSPDEAGRLGDRVLALEGRVEALRAAMGRASKAVSALAANIGQAAAEGAPATSLDLGRLEGVATALAVMATDAGELLHEPLPEAPAVPRSKR
jgi:hypothetical protein